MKAMTLWQARWNMIVRNDLAGRAGIRLSSFFKRGRVVFTILMYLFLSVIAFVFVYPFLYMVITSMKSLEELFDLSINWIPRAFYIKNYTYAYNLLGYTNHFPISFIVTAVSIVIKVTCCSFIGYGFARYDFPGKKILFFLSILSIIMPIQTILLPQYLIFSSISWTGSYLPIIVPQIFGYGLRGGLFIFLFRQFFLNLPKSLEEAARIDGCGAFNTFWKIALPSVRTSIVVTIVLAMVWHWNDYYEPAIYINQVQMLPLPAMLPRIFTMYKSYFGGEINAAGTNPAMLVNTIVTEGTLMASIFLVIAPVLFIYMFLQRKFMQGIERSGLVE
ncbi:MAG: carbohydrate ABC transporter permease [Saccharofermentanales bacterium]